MSTFGEIIKISLFGESHGSELGITIHGLPANKTLNLSSIEHALSLRRPQFSFTTSRIEDDDFRIVSGFHNQKTTGMPLTIIVANTDVDSSSYEYNPFRPGHADYPAFIKYGGANDTRGGGHFSGRLTAPLIILGDIARQYLEDYGVKVFSHVRSIHSIEGESVSNLTLSPKFIETLQNSAFPVLNSDLKTQFTKKIEAIKLDSDSVGGIIETVVLNPPIGLGEPFFDSLESILCHLLFSIPSVKGVSFGKGFELAKMTAKEANDPIRVIDGTVNFSKNDMGGVLGGLSTGQSIIFNTAIKPTPTIASSQDTITRDNKNITYAFKGRHDSCIVPRALHVVNALTAYTIFELLLRKEATLWKK
ncbi:MAG: chorismate synthase [Candidatus Izemoplasmataceae bacterium]